MHKRSWDDLRFVLAVADHGSVSRAARILGVNHATVLRRVAAFEDSQGEPVFEKTAVGYRVLPDKVRVIEAAREVQNAHVTVDRLMQGARASPRGMVRVSSTDTFCQYVLAGFAARLQQRLPGLEIELISTNTHLDFARMQADISVRPALKLPEDMVGDTSARLAFGAFSAPDAPARWLNLSGPLARSVPGKWLADTVPPDQIAGGADSFLVLAEMAALGAGIAILPILVANRMPGLQPWGGDDLHWDAPVWVATHSDLRDAPRITLVRTELLGYLSDVSDLLSGVRS